MLALRSGTHWEVRAPAKLNLHFEVLARRPDGFHEIETLMVPVGVYDSLLFRDDPSGQIQLTCSSAVKIFSDGASLGDLPPAEENLVVRAVKLLRKRAGIDNGAKMRLVKRIPSAAGLGGGSSDAAAALALANQAWGIDLSVTQLADLASELGSDVPFFLTPGAAVCRGRGEQVCPVGGLEQLHFVIVRPPVGLSTAAVYQACTPNQQASRPEALIAALRQGDLGRAGSLLCNRLQPAAEKLSPWIGRLQTEFDRADCLGHQMSGSGSSYFALCRHARHARQMANRIRLRDLGSVFTASSCL